MGGEPGVQPRQVHAVDPRRLRHGLPQHHQLLPGRLTRSGRQRPAGDAIALALQAAALVNRRQLAAYPGQVDAIGLADLLDMTQRAIGGRQRPRRITLAQGQFGLPHLTQRLAQGFTGTGIQQGGGLGQVVQVGVFLQHALHAAEGASLTRLSAVIAMVVQVGHAGLGIAALPLAFRRRKRSGLLAEIVDRQQGRRWHRRRIVNRQTRAFLGLLAHELAVAQAQHALVDTEGIGAAGELRRRQCRLLLQQRLGIDDDLPLAAEIRGQHVAGEGVQPVHVGRRRGRPAQDQARAPAALGTRRAVVPHLQADYQVFPLLQAKRERIERGFKAPAGRWPAAAEGAGTFGKGDVLAGALGQGQMQGGLGGHAVVIAGLERQRPLALARLHQAEALLGQQHPHRRRLVGDGIQPVQRRHGLRCTARGQDAIQRGAGQQVLRAPVAIRRFKFDFIAVVEGEHGAVRIRGKAQGPAQPRAFRSLHIQRLGIPRFQPGVGRRLDVQPP